MCGSYTINCGIPPIQNTGINCPEVARGTLSVSCQTDLLYCVLLIGSVCFLHTSIATWKAFKQLIQDFPVVSLYFACLLTLTASTAAIFTENLNQSQASFEISCHNKTSGQFLESFFCIKNKSVCEYCSPTPFTNSVHIDYLYIRNQLNPPGCFRHRLVAACFNTTGTDRQHVRRPPQQLHSNLKQKSD